MNNSEEKKLQELSPEKQELINKVLDLMKQGKLAWQSPVYGLENAVTERNYKGINLLLLCFSSMENGYKDPRWATFNQCKDKGWSVKKGAKGTSIYVYKKIDRATNKEFDQAAFDLETEGMTTAEKSALFAKKVRILNQKYTVFNAEQIAGIPAIQAKQTVPTNEKLEKIIENSPVPILYEAVGVNYYVPLEDRIYLAPRDSFRTTGEFYGTALHEMAHAVMHADRTGIVFGNSQIEYAKEELRAELASVFLQQSYGIELPRKQLENHSAYLQSWISIIENAPAEFFLAVKDATKISDYIIEREQVKQAEQTEQVGQAKQVEKHKKKNNSVDEKLREIAVELNFADPGRVITATKPIILKQQKASNANQSFAQSEQEKS